MVFMGRCSKKRAQKGVNVIKHPPPTLKKKKPQKDFLEKHSTSYHSCYTEGKSRPTPIEGKTLSNSDNKQCSRAKWCVNVN